MILTLRETIPSGSDNAPYSAEMGNHWPAGQQFKTLSRTRERNCRRTRGLAGRVLLEQIGGEEVILAVPAAEMPRLFGVSAGLIP